MLSIIIPVYNAAATLPRCLDTIYHQMTDEAAFEIVTINDGSADTSLSVLQDYAKKHGNITVVSQQNQGVSAARNHGLQLSKGDFITFVDADDTIGTASLPDLTAFLAQPSEANIIVLRSFLSTGREYYQWQNTFNDGESYACADVVNRGYHRGSVCGCCFRKAFLEQHSILFNPKIRIGEDTLFLFECMSHSAEMAFKSIDFYHVEGAADSASRTFSVERIERSAAALSDFWDAISRFPQTDSSRIVSQYLKYLVLSNIVFDTLRTPSAGLLLLLRRGVHRYSHIDMRGLHSKLGKLRLLNLSFSLYYLMFKLNNLRRIS